MIRCSMAGFDRLTDAKQRRTGPELPLDPRVQKGLGLGVVTKVRNHGEKKRKILMEKGPFKEEMTREELIKKKVIEADEDI